MFKTICANCLKEQSEEQPITRCNVCGGMIDFKYDFTRVKHGRDPSSMWNFADLLPVRDPTNAVTLGEGNTPLLRSNLLPGINLYLKDETRNPTGSMKDRAASVSVTKAREFGVKTVIIFTTGSAGLSASAYAARGGLTCVVLVPQGTPVNRTLPMLYLGAKVCEVDTEVDETMRLVEECSMRYGYYQATTSRDANPYQAEAAKTIAYEMACQHPAGFDWVFVPVGGGGTLSAIWKGFKEAKKLGLINNLPKMVGVQARYYDALVIAAQRGIRDEETIKHLLDDMPKMETVLVKLNHKFPHDAVSVLQAIDESGGIITSVGDQEAMEEVQRLGAEEGILIEPSSAVAIVALRELVRKGLIKSGDEVALVLTGAGIREVNTLQDKRPLETIKISKIDGLDTIRRIVESA